MCCAHLAASTPAHGTHGTATRNAGEHENRCARPQHPSALRRRPVFVRGRITGRKRVVVSTQPSTESDGSAPDDRTIRIWRAHWQDEIDAQHLYLRLADSSPNREKRSLYRKFADVERQHIAIWERSFAEHAIAAGARRPSFRARALAGIGRILGPRVLHSVLVREEAAEVRGYLSLDRQARPGSTAEALQRLATESAHHAETLAQMAGRIGEPWHGIAPGPAACCAMWCTDSTTA